ncbi:uncharacterized protein [Mytilus edulis]|uniref:uncharacterized protein n=1 Tax=Mytilus edulis TaxID=6550 RepID=UPI0039EE55FD
MAGPIKSDEDQNANFNKISLLAGSEKHSTDHCPKDITNKEDNMDLFLPFSEQAVPFSSMTYNLVTSKSPPISPVEKYTTQACEESNMEAKWVAPFKKSSSVQQELHKSVKDERINKRLKNGLIKKSGNALRKDEIKGFHYFRKLKIQRKRSFDERENKGLENWKIKKRGKVLSVAVRKEGIKGYRNLRKQKLQWKDPFDERENKGLENWKIKKRGKVLSVAVRKEGIKGYRNLRKQKLQWKDPFDERENKGLENWKIKKRGKVLSVAVRKEGIKGYRNLRKQKLQWKDPFDERENKGLENWKIKKRGKVLSVAVRKEGIKGYRNLRKQKLQWKDPFDLNRAFQYVRLTTLCSTILQLLLFMVCFCGTYGKSTENPPCQLMFAGQLYSDKLLLKCFYNEHCKGTLKWTGGKSGTTLFNVETKRTEKVRFIDGKSEKWFGMQIQNWNREDIEANYKCWFGFSKLIVNIVNRAVLNQPFDADLVQCKRINGVNNLILNAKVLHTNRQPSFTAFIQDKNITKHLTSIENPTKNGSWIETWIKLNLKLTEEDNNKTLMILFKEKIIIKKVINTKLCRGNEDSLKIPCGDKVCQVLLLCLGGLGVLAAASFCIVYKKDLLCFKKETDNTGYETEPMANTNDDAVSRRTQTSTLTDY